MSHISLPASKVIELCCKKSDYIKTDIDRRKKLMYNKWYDIHEKKLRPNWLQKLFGVTEPTKEKIESEMLRKESLCDFDYQSYLDRIDASWYDEIKTITRLLSAAMAINDTDMMQIDTEDFYTIK